MRNIIIAIVVLAIVGISAYFLVFNKAPQTNTTASNAAETNSNNQINITQDASTSSPENSTPVIVVATSTITVTAPTPLTALVSIKNYAYSPTELNIKAGTKVTWTNNDSAPHTVTSDSDGLLVSATLNQGQSYTYTFTKVGVTYYHCAFHPMMKGSVIVSQ